VHLGTWGPQDRTSAFHARNWLGPNRPAGVRRKVQPGRTAHVLLHLRAPRRPGRYVERRSDPRDRRVKLLALTPEGRRVREEIRARLAAPPEPLERLPEADQLALRDLLRKALNA